MEILFQNDFIKFHLIYPHGTEGNFNKFWCIIFHWRVSEGVRDGMVGCSSKQLERLLQETNDGSRRSALGVTLDHPDQQRSSCPRADTKSTFFIMLLYRYHWWFDPISTTWSQPLTCTRTWCHRTLFIIVCVLVFLDSHVDSIVIMLIFNVISPTYQTYCSIKLDGCIGVFVWDKFD